MMNDVVYLVLQLSIQKEEAKKKEVHIEENVPAPSPRSNCSVLFFPSHFFGFPDKFLGRSVLVAKPERMNVHVLQVQYRQFC